MSYLLPAATENVIYKIPPTIGWHRINKIESQRWYVRVWLCECSKCCDEHFYWMERRVALMTATVACMVWRIDWNSNGLAVSSARVTEGQRSTYSCNFFLRISISRAWRCVVWKKYKKSWLSGAHPHTRNNTENPVGPIAAIAHAIHPFACKMNRMNFVIWNITI